MIIAMSYLIINSATSNKFNFWKINELGNVLGCKCSWSIKTDKIRFYFILTTKISDSHIATIRKDFITAIFFTKISICRYYFKGAFCTLLCVPTLQCVRTVYD